MLIEVPVAGHAHAGLDLETYAENVPLKGEGAAVGHHLLHSRGHIVERAIYKRDNIDAHQIEQDRHRVPVVDGDRQGIIHGELAIVAHRVITVAAGHFMGI